MLLIDDINQIAKEAGLSSSDPRIKQLAKAAYDLGRQHERKACAELCDEVWDGDADTYEYCRAANECAMAIRERGKP